MRPAIYLISEAAMVLMACPGRGFTYGWWWSCPRWERETMADRVTWYASRGMRAGTFTHSFEAIATTVGHFALPPAQVMAVMQPEVLGLSTGGTFQVGAVGELSEEEMRALPGDVPPNGCPADCSGSGICDVVTGTCQCSAGAAGADCSEAALPLAMELGVQQSDPTVVALVASLPTLTGWVRHRMTNWWCRPRQLSWTAACTHPLCAGRWLQASRPAQPRSRSWRHVVPK